MKSIGIDKDLERDLKNDVKVLGERYLTLYSYRACAHCEGEISEHWVGDEGWSICAGCRATEGDELEMYIDDSGELYTIEAGDALIESKRAGLG